MSKQYIPKGLWDGLQDMFFRHDNRFLEKVSLMFSIPIKELRAKITGTRGVLTLIPEAAGPFWMGTACPVMTRIGYLLQRCIAPAEHNGYCVEHHKGGVHYDDDEFKDVPARVPFRYNGDIYWVSEDTEDVLNVEGMPVCGFRVDLKTRTVILNNALATEQNGTGTEDE
jgi:hypothetical protein